MKYIRQIFLLVTFLYSCSKNKNEDIPKQTYPPYELIKQFSKKINKTTNLVLVGYGINFGLPKNYKFRNGIGNFRASYYLNTTKKNTFSIEFSRKLMIYIAENLLETINTSSEIKPDLDVYPFTGDELDITIHFKDENKIDLGQGVAAVDLADGKIIYEGYNITEYTGKYPAIGKHYTILEESYADALNIVKKQGNLKYLELSDKTEKKRQER